MATTLTFSLFFTFTLTLILLLLLTNAQENTETPPPSPNLIAPSQPDTVNTSSSPSFRPGFAVVACVLTTMFSVTSLLLYIKHCNNVNTDAAGTSTPWTAAPFAGRKNSGIDRTVVESLPVFRFGALRGQKDGLDCAVCLNKFEAAEVLRLLPKCKHAFHVECVDTWLDAHSTCPLCRYRVDPEDILLVNDDNSAGGGANTNTNTNANAKSQQECVRSGFVDLEKQEIVESKRRHSSVGEREGERGRERERERETVEQSKRWTTSFRRSLDSVTAISRKKNESVGCFVRARKDGMLLLTQETETETERERDRDRTSVSVERRLEHRIIVSPGPASGPGPGPGPIGVQERWSDVHASDLLYLTTEMIMSEAQWNYTRRGGRRKGTRRTNDGSEDSWNGRGIINSRSVSEITGLSRFWTNDDHNNSDVRVWEQQHRDREIREESLVRRWLGWISISISKS